MSVTRHHADWLSLVEVSGPFISLPVLMRAFPQGLEARDADQAKALRTAYEEWQDNPTAPGMQQAWILHVLSSVMGYPEDLLTESQGLPPGLDLKMPEFSETLRPSFALVGPAGSDLANKPQLLISSYPSEQNLEKPVTGKYWKATPATRMTELLHGTGVPLGLVTNGEHWMLVYAPRGETSGYASWYAGLWLEEHITLRAFHSLLGVRRFFGVDADNTLLGLLKESATDQQEVTDQLGYQVREAVEVMVQSIDAIDKESNRENLRGIKPTTVYDATLTVMMRLVFLLSAEERGLLHLGKPLYDDNYAVSTLQEQLQEVADRYGEELLERRIDAWTRLIAVFRAIHGGIQHQDLSMQAYGGSLFDPDRYPFLEGRAEGTSWRDTPAEPLAINNRVVLHLLNSLQRLRTKVGGRGSTETRRVSFRALGVEQIGHVYEGLLDHTAFRAKDVVLGIRGTRNSEPEIPLSELEELLQQGENKLLNYLKKETGRSLSAIRRDFNEEGLFDKHKLLVACDHDEEALARVIPFAGLIREDSFERPWIIMPGSVYVTAGDTRRSTGTHYTPPSLTKPVVQHTLEPLVYQGPAEGLPKDQWKLKSPQEILELRVCDMAMGSGAFLVQVCRYLADRLVESWEIAEKAHPEQVLITPEGKFSEGSPSERLVPVDVDERVAIARRVVADRCIYGVDINPMAVEMAKLSLWLITVDANRPFTFLDHAFKCGDSLLGLSSLDQLEYFSMRPAGGKREIFSTLNLWRHIEEAQKKRTELEAMPSDTPDQVAQKKALNTEANLAVEKLHAAADILLSVELKSLKGKAYEAEREDAADYMMFNWAQGKDQLFEYARERLCDRQSFHWPFAYPEVFGKGGFHAIVGNPPFMGGQKISGALGKAYRDYLVIIISDNRKGSADLCAYFLLRSIDIIRNKGIVGLLATNTVSQGDTSDIGLNTIISKGNVIIRAIPSSQWPGTAAIVIAQVWLRKGEWHGSVFLRDKQVIKLTQMLTVPGNVSGTPYKLSSNSHKSFQGSIVLGKGFIISNKKAKELLSSNSENRNCLFPYLIGRDVNTNPKQTPSRWVINFFDWPLNRNAEGFWSESTQKERKEWLRLGTVPSDYPNPVAADYPELLSIVESNVKPERTRKNKNGEYALRYPLYIKWWIYAEKRPLLYSVIQNMDKVLCVSQATKYIQPYFVNTGPVFDQALIIITLNDYFSYAVLNSSFHVQWAEYYRSSLGKTNYYIPSKVFVNFPFPKKTDYISEIGRMYYNKIKKVMVENDIGLTQAYNKFHDEREKSEDILSLRHLYKEMDVFVAEAYEWSDLDLSHGFYATDQGIRYCVSEETGREILDRLLALNHARYAAEKNVRNIDNKSTSVRRSPAQPSDGSDLTLDL